MQAVFNFRGMLAIRPYEPWMRDEFSEALTNTRFMLLEYNPENPPYVGLNRIVWRAVGKSADYIYFEGEVID